MANKVFKGIRMPGLNDFYVLPEAVAIEDENGFVEIQSYISDTVEIENLDTTLTKSGMAADAAEVGKILNQKVDKVDGEAWCLTVGDSLTIKRGNQAEGAYFYTYVDDHDYPTVELLGTANDDFVKLYGIANPTQSNDAVNKQYVDTNFAPAGLVNGIYYVTSLADFESRIEEVYNSMENCTERVIQMDLTSGTTEVNSGDWYITIARRNANNGFLRMTKSLDSVVSHQRYRYDGSWGPWTWETPLMRPGVEYRTTERYKGKAVYTKLLDFGTLPSSGVKSLTVGGATEWVDLDVIFSDGNMSTGGQDKGENTLYINTTLYAKVYFTFNSVCIESIKDCSHYTATAVVKYTKD